MFIILAIVNIVYSLLHDEYRQGYQPNAEGDTAHHLQQLQNQKGPKMANRVRKKVNP